MDKDTRSSYMKALVDRDAGKLRDLAGKMGKRAEDCLQDILTLTVTTTHEGKTSPAARTELYFDGDIDIALPGPDDKIDLTTLDFHQKTVDLAMKNRRELIRTFAELFDLENVIKIL
jgi:hypothetical protein